MLYAINRNGYLIFEYGQTPFPQGAVWPVDEKIVRSYNQQNLKIVDGKLIPKTKEEIRIMNQPAKYRKDGGLDKDGNRIWIELTEQEMTTADKQEDDDFKQQQVNEEISFQNDKPYELKQAENNFLTMCDLLTNTKEHKKITLSETYTLIDKLENLEVKLTTAIKLLAIDAEGKREGGELWWNTCKWHEEI